MWSSFSTSKATVLPSSRARSLPVELGLLSLALAIVLGLLGATAKLSSNPLVRGVKPPNDVDSWRAGSGR